MDDTNQFFFYFVSIFDYTCVARRTPENNTPAHNSPPGNKNRKAGPYCSRRTQTLTSLNMIGPNSCISRSALCWLIKHLFVAPFPRRGKGIIKKFHTRKLTHCLKHPASLAMICTLTFKVDRAKTTEQQEGFVPVLVSVDLMQITF